MGDIGPVRERYEVLPIRGPEPGAKPGPAREREAPFPTGRRENWLTRTARVLR